MLIKISPIFLLVLLTAVPGYHAIEQDLDVDTTAAANCVWRGTAPFCNGQCPQSHPRQIAEGRGGCGNGNRCLNSGRKVFCCSNTFTRTNCTWETCTLNPRCPFGKSQVTVTDKRGDGGQGCSYGNCRVLCCNN